MGVSAMQGFKDSFSQHFASMSSDEIVARKNSVRAYYTDQFGQEFMRLNGGNNIDINQLISPLDNNAIALQYDFISNNEQPLGNKHLLTSLTSDLSYNQFHKKYHAVLTSFI